MSTTTRDIIGKLERLDGSPYANARIRVRSRKNIGANGSFVPKNAQEFKTDADGFIKASDGISTAKLKVFDDGVTAVLYDWELPADALLPVGQRGSFSAPLVAGAAISLDALFLLIDTEAAVTAPVQSAIDSAVQSGISGSVVRHDEFQSLSSPQQSQARINIGAAAASDVTQIALDLALKAPSASPAFTGTPTAPTPAQGDNSTRISTTAFVAAALAQLVSSSPAALDTLNELAAALGNDANFAATMTNALAAKAPLASPALTGNPTAPTQNEGDSSTRLATTAFAQLAVKGWFGTKELAVEDYKAQYSNNGDDSPALQAAINSFGTKAGTVHFTKDTTLSAPINLYTAARTNLALVSNTGVKIDVRATGQTVFYGTNFNQLILEKLMFWGNNVVQSNPAFYDAYRLFEIGAAESFTIRDCEFWNLACTDSLIRAYMTRLNIENSQFWGSFAPNLIYLTVSGGLRIRHSRIHDIGSFNGNSYGKAVYHGKRWVFVDFNSADLSGGGQNGISIEDFWTDEGVDINMEIRGALGGVEIKRWQPNVWSENPQAAALRLVGVPSATISGGWAGVYTPGFVGTRPWAQLINCGKVYFEKNVKAKPNTAQVQADYTSSVSFTDSPDLSLVAMAATRINAGGSAAAPFSADTGFSSSTIVDWAGINSISYNKTGVTNPAPNAVYQFARVAPAGVGSTLTFTQSGLIAGGTYFIRLWFYEGLLSMTPGGRVFDVAINGVTVLSNFDIMTAAGGNDKAYVFEGHYSANGSGQILVTLTNKTQLAIISGVEILG